jgi:hypothetical protein
MEEEAFRSNRSGAFDRAWPTDDALVNCILFQLVAK